MPANFGQFRHLVEIQQSTPQTDSAGGTVDVWTTLTKVYARIEPVSGREADNAGQVESVVTHLIRSWWITSFTVRPAMRVLYGARAFNIESVINVNEENERMELQCSEIING